jgi:6-phosphogluconolactonase (cycloisomerase 2 family)
MDKWTRREFVRGAAGVVALPAWLPQGSGTGFAYVSSANHMIHAFHVRGGQWTPIQQIVSVAPSAIAVSGDVLYAANDVALFDRLSRGSVQCFRIGHNGRLALMQRVPLSLSATHPRSLAVSPDGKLLAVAAYADAIYNLFAIADDGSLGSTCGIFKDIGCAHPHAIAFNSTGTRLLSYDVESARPKVFAVESGSLMRVTESTPPQATEKLMEIAGDSIYYRTAKVAHVPAARSIAIKV